jgi:hypothetical protein
LRSSSHGGVGHSDLCRSPSGASERDPESRHPGTRTIDKRNRKTLPSLVLTRRLIPPPSVCSATLAASCCLLPQTAKVADRSAPNPDPMLRSYLNEGQGRPKPLFLPMSTIHSAPRFEPDASIQYREHSISKAFSNVEAPRHHVVASRLYFHLTMFHSPPVVTALHGSLAEVASDGVEDG